MSYQWQERPALHIVHDDDPAEVFVPEVFNDGGLLRGVLIAAVPCLAFWIAVVWLATR